MFVNTFNTMNVGHLLLAGYFLVAPNEPIVARDDFSTGQGSVDRRTEATQALSVEPLSADREIIYNVVKTSYFTASFF